MAVMVRATNSLTTVKLEATSTGNGAPAPENLNPPAAARPLLSVVSKPSWVVRTEACVSSFGCFLVIWSKLRKTLRS
ncbi:UNVERIFIED_CONTAM: hypothetical protein Sradi_5814700 [Sesamum radiatum]|uniref:Uncharacterized protein n=1 Tax=Sesamum radiatum TaxID=300843 RepID=A0AAW2KQZ6_SESRA